MRHQSLREVHRRADFHEAAERDLLSPSDRLERWAAVLHRHPHLLNTFEGTEYKSSAERAVMRQDNSPLAVAYADPILREAGLADDSYGEAKRFFSLTDHQLHYLICDCHCGARISGTAAAARVRMAIPGRSWLFGVLGALRRWLG